MTKTKIALYLALIFLAGGLAGAGITSARKAVSPPPHGPGGGPRGDRPPMSPEEFQAHIFNRIKERLALTPEQVEKVEPVFRKGWEDVHAIQDRSVKEVEAAVKRNHDDIGKLVTPEQRQKLEDMDREREKAFREHRGHRRGPGMGGPPPGPGGPPPNDGSGPETKPKDAPEKTENKAP